MNKMKLKKTNENNAAKAPQHKPLGTAGRIGFAVYAAAVLCAFCLPCNVFAADDPLVGGSQETDPYEPQMIDKIELEVDAPAPAGLGYRAGGLVVPEP